MGAEGTGVGEAPPLMVSLCGTYLKPEMQSIYRQIANLKAFRTTVYAEQVQNLDQFPHDPVVGMEKRKRPRYRGNLFLRFWYKHVVRQWPPPRPIGHVGMGGAYYHPYDLVDLLEKDRPELVHVYYGHKAVKYHRMLKAWGGPFIVSFHGVDVVKFMDEPGYAESMRAMLGDAELVLARSGSLLDEVRGLGCDPAKLRLNRTPIPFVSGEPVVRRPPGDGRWRLVQACRLIPKKGLFTTVEAMRKVVEIWPETKFVLAGKGPVEERFREAVAGAGLGDNVEMLGWVDQAALVEEFRRAHLFLHPSELTGTSDQEGVPNSMLEAMASGLPVVATFHGGIPEAATDRHDGRLVPEKSPAALAAALLEVMGDPAALATYSANAARTVREKFGLEEQVAALESCYREAIGSPAARQSEGEGDA